LVEYRENPIRDAYSKFDEYIEHCYHARCPVFVWGPPGIGKSDGIKRVARKLGIKCIDMRLNAVDANGCSRPARATSNRKDRYP